MAGPSIEMPVLCVLMIAFGLTAASGDDVAWKLEYDGEELPQTDTWTYTGPEGARGITSPGSETRASPAWSSSPIRG